MTNTLKHGTDWRSMEMKEISDLLRSLNPRSEVCPDQTVWGFISIVGALRALALLWLYRLTGDFNGALERKSLPDRIDTILKLVAMNGVSEQLRGCVCHAWRQALVIDQLAEALKNERSFPKGYVLESVRYADQPPTPMELKSLIHADSEVRALMNRLVDLLEEVRDASVPR